MLDLASRPANEYDHARIGLKRAMADNDDTDVVERAERHRTGRNAGLTDIRLLEKDFEFLGRTLKAVEGNIGLRLDGLSTQFKDFITEARTTFATKAELVELKNKYDALQESISWAVKIIIGAVLVGVLALVINKSGGVITTGHP